MPLSIACLVAWVLAPEAEPEAPASAPSDPFEVVEPADAPSDEPSAAPVRPPEPPPPPEPAKRRLPNRGISPFDYPSPARPPTPGVPRGGARPLGRGPSESAVPTLLVPRDAALPLGTGPEPEVPEPPDPRVTRIVRLDYWLGPVFRLRPVDTMTTLGMEVGPEHGFSGTFHTSMILASDREIVRVVDVPIGLGAVFRARHPTKLVYGSVGLSAGIMVHRAATTDGVSHRVDPDFRLPIRAAWTVSSVGVSVALVPGYSVRARSYERRGVEVWNRHSVRIGLLFGLHWDIMAGRAKAARSGRRRETDR